MRRRREERRGERGPDRREERNQGEEDRRQEMGGDTEEGSTASIVSQLSTYLAVLEEFFLPFPKVLNEATDNNISFFLQCSASVRRYILVERPTAGVTEILDRNLF